MPNETLFQVLNFNPPLPKVSHPWVVSTSCVGVEVELEGVENEGDLLDYWNVIGDGSLRGGCEFVMSAPTGGEDLVHAIIELDTYLSDKHPDGNWRCSTHVHIDARDMNLQEIKNFILIYTVLEKALFRLSGMSRYKNNFCCALGFAQQQIKVLSDNWKHPTLGRFLQGALQSWDKYSAINLIPMADYGSIEFRLSEATWSKGKLLLLCNRFLAMKELARNWMGTEQELVDHVYNTDLSSLFPKGLGKNPPEIPPEDLMVGYKLASDLLVFSQLGPVVERNNQEVASEIWFEVDAASGEMQTIPYALFVDSDSPVIKSLSRDSWRALCGALRSDGIYVTGDMHSQLNMACLRWVLSQGEWSGRQLLSSRSEYDLYCDWCESNPLL